MFAIFFSPSIRWFFFRSLFLISSPVYLIFFSRLLIKNPFAEYHICSVCVCVCMSTECYVINHYYEPLLPLSRWIDLISAYEITFSLCIFSTEETHTLSPFIHYIHTFIYRWTNIGNWYWFHSVLFALHSMHVSLYSIYVVVCVCLCAMGAFDVAAFGAQTSLLRSVYVL